MNEARAPAPGELAPVPTLVITGPVGVGKSSVAVAVGEILDEAGLSHALVDLDWLRWCTPRPPDDPFHIALGLRNLAAVWANYRAAGAARLILVDVVEARADLEGYRTAVPGAAILVVRLRATLPTILRRLEGRETGAALEWHRRRAAVLVPQMDRDRVEDLLVDAEGRTPAEIAREIVDRTGFTGRRAAP
ncbi:MAG TPA: hypothetical protein VNL77_19720 [Roseiflexaceae bacterium]|nr:hypothetical protein [Roseiflexaceae bacterium]